jgi:hypothetical protein
MAYLKTLRLRRIIKIYQDSRLLDRDSNRVPLEYKSVALPIYDLLGVVMKCEKYCEISVSHSGEYEDDDGGSKHL